MRVVILTGSRFGAASACLPVLVEHPRIEVAGILLNEGRQANRWAFIRRHLRKIRRIGPFGALVGYRMRAWYRDSSTEDLLAVAKRHAVPVTTTPAIDSARTRELFVQLGADLGLSLSTGYIPASVFELPRYGMINVHGELLPRFQGAASVIWAIYEGIGETGFTIHQIDRGLDTGAILYQEQFPIRFHRTLRDTVRENCREITRRAPAAVASVIADYSVYASRAAEQSGGRKYTTPTLTQFVRMMRQHRRMRRHGPRS